MKKLFLFLLLALCLPVLAGAQTINEIDPDQAGTDSAEFVELLGTPGASADGLVLVLFNGSDDASYNAIDLDGLSFDANGLLVINLPSDGLQNGADAVALFTGDATDFPNDTPVTMTNLLDAIVYGTNDADDTALLTGLGETVQYNDAADTSIQSDGNGGYANGAPTEGLPNDTTPPVFDCPALSLNIGDACNDNNAVTTNDVVLADCSCAGTAIVFDCPALSLNIGDTCDDANATTTGDVIQADCSCAGTVPSGACPAAFVNEFHYDNDGTDAGEFIEIAVPTGADASGLTINAYNGNGGVSYGSYTLTAGDLAGSDATYDYYVWSVVLQNGNDGISLSCADGTVLDFISYEGPFAATDGPASGLTATDTGASEPSTAAIGSSLQFLNGVWTYTEGVNTQGATNDVAAPVFDCPALSLNIGDACNDNNAATTNDVVLADCSCAGTAIVFDCPALSLNIGDTCDDANATTTGDVIQADCTCAGTPVGATADLYISELSFNPCTEQGNDGDCEYIIITNNGAMMADISNYSIGNGFTYTFPAGTTIAAGGTLSLGISANCAGLSNFDLSGGWSGSMSNSTDETVEILDATGALVSSVTYDGSLGDGNCLANCFDIAGVASECASSLYDDTFTPTIATIADPCGCDDANNIDISNPADGVVDIFFETVTIVSGNLENWDVDIVATPSTANGILDMTGAAIATVTFTEVDNLDGTSTYTANFYHAATTGYNATFTNGTITLSANNSCTACTPSNCNSNSGTFPYDGQ